MTSKIVDPYSREAMEKEYARLCGIRDKANEDSKEDQRLLDEVNAKIISLQAEALGYAKSIEKRWNLNQDWLKLKKDIAVLARALSRFKPQEKSKQEQESE